MRKKLLILVLAVFGIVGVAYAGSNTVSGMGPTMTQRGTEYCQDLYISTSTPRSMRSVTWQQSFDMGQLCVPSPGGEQCSTPPQPTPMPTYICLHNVSCARIDGQATGSTNAWWGRTWSGTVKFSFCWQPGGSGGLYAKGKTNRVTVNW